MQIFTLLPLFSILSPLILSALARAAPSDVSKRSDDVNGDPELTKRLSSFVRIDRPSSFMRFIRGLPIGEDLEDKDYDVDGETYSPDNNSRFVRCDKASGYEGKDLEDSPENRVSRFLCFGRASRYLRFRKSDPEIKRMPSFVHVSKSDPYLDKEDLNKRVSSFMLFRRIPSSAFVRIDKREANPQKLAAGQAENLEH